MGQNLSQEIQKTTDEKVRLELYEKEREMRRKYEEKKAQLYIEALNDECLPILCAVDRFYDILFNVKKHTAGTVPSDTDPYDIKITMEKHLQGKYLTKLVELLRGVVEKVLEQSTKVDEVEQTHMHVVSANENILRIDYYLYLSKLTSGENALFFYVQVGAIDMARARLPVLIYELTRATNSEELGKAGVDLENIAKSSIRLHKAVKILANAAKQNVEGAGEKEEGGEEEGGEEEEEEGGEAGEP